MPRFCDIFPTQLTAEYKFPKNREIREGEIVRVTFITNPVVTLE